MRIGLLRHFPVDMPQPQGWITSAELRDWQTKYDEADVRVCSYTLGDIAWKHCISSDLLRATSTAKVVYQGDFHTTATLREPQIGEFGTGSLRLPLWAWRLLLRLTWMTGHRSQRASRDDFKQRVKSMVDQLRTSETDTLVVCHAGMMMFLAKELKAHGFSGPKMGIPKHAHVYVYQR
jgi:broad specificity phosphatase PhoE